MDASCKIQRSIHDVRLTYKYVSRILGTYQEAAAPLLCLVLAEALAVGALIHGGMALMGTDLNGAQAAVIHLTAVMGAAGDGTLDGGVGGAGAPIVGTIGHRFLPP